LDSPDGKPHNQIEHILIDRRRNSNVLDVQSFRAADCDTNHYLVVAKVRERLAVNKQRSHRFRMEGFNLKKLSEVEDMEQYIVEVSIGLQLWKIWMQRRKLIVIGKRLRIITTFQTKRV
jgi:hypothetical protein